MKREGELWRFTRHRRGRWLNNLVEQDHRRIKRRTGPMLGFQSFWTARRTLAGVEAMAMLAKGQVRAVPRERHAGPASLRPPDLRPRGLSEGERAGARLQSANATEPIFPFQTRKLSDSGPGGRAKHKRPRISGTFDVWTGVFEGPN